MIVDGGETGSVAQLAAVGSSARIVDFEPLDDGLLGILCRGERRFRLLQRRVQADGLYVGQVRWLDDPPHTPLGDARRPLGNVLRKVIGEYGELARHLQPDFGDAGWVANRFAELLPLSRAAQQQLLEIDDPAARLDGARADDRRALTIRSCADAWGANLARGATPLRRLLSRPRRLQRGASTRTTSLSMLPLACSVMRR